MLLPRGVKNKNVKRAAKWNLKFPPEINEAIITNHEI